MPSDNFSRLRTFAWLLGVAGSLWCHGQAQAQPTILSVVPANGATGVSTNTTVVFTFSEAMDTNATAVFFFTPSFSQVATTPSWNLTSTILTCTPVPSFPANTTITWFASAQNPMGDPVTVNTSGTFSTTTGGGGGGGGSGTNKITSFSLGKIYFYNQTSTNLPVHDPDIPYTFSASTSLASNRTATAVQLTLPSSSISNLVQNFLHHEDYNLFVFSTNQAAIETTFGSGNYLFNVQAAASNQMVTVNFPAGLLQPGAPHLTNYPAAQAVDPTQPFVLGWDGFVNGGVTDAVSVVIGDNVYSSTNLGSPGALNGTARTFTIPANTLAANSSYDSSIGFYRALVATNGNNYSTFVYRASTTQFTLITGSVATGGLISLTNAVYAGGVFSCDVRCSSGQTVTVQYRTNLTAGSWQTLFTTNSPAAQFHVASSSLTTNRTLFLRAKNGP